jgi:GH25 family lysozyme M1 (1,4-beta-N-acetylmuramidase)
MKLNILSLLFAAAASASPLEARASGVQGFDISGYQPTVDFAGAYKSGARFVMIKVSCHDSFSDDITLLTRPGH